VALQRVSPQRRVQREFVVADVRQIKMKRPSLDG
jgi:hypothetical protein